MVLGIPTVKRQYQSYLVSNLYLFANSLSLLLEYYNDISSVQLYRLLQVTTLQSVLENMTLEEMEDTLIIIFIAETDPDSVFQISSDVQKQFHQARNQKIKKKKTDVPIPSTSNLASWR